MRYVGKTVGKISIRLSKHKYRRNKSSSHKNNWLQLLEREGLLDDLQIVVIEECDILRLSKREKYWIAYYKKQGCDLTNVTPGGEVGSLGHRHSKEAKKKISEAAKRNKGRKASKEARKRISASLLGNTRRKGILFAEASKRKISKNRKGIPAWNKKKVVQLTLRGIVIKTWGSVDEAQKTLGIRNISCAARHKDYRKQAGGFAWRYIDD